MRILHTGDMHLGRLFYSKSLLEDQAFLLKEILRISEQEKIDALIIAGDIYDRAVPPGEAVDLLDEFLFTLINDLKIKVFVISGNHDSPERLSFVSRMLKAHGLYIAAKFSGLPEEIIIEDEHGPVSFFLVPYIQFPALKTFFSQDFKSYNDAMAFFMDKISPVNNRTVAVSHCFVSGAFTSESERPFSIGGSDIVSAEIFSKFTYTALGHLHRAQEPAENIHYSGSIYPYSFSEISNNNSVNIIDLGSDGISSIKKVQVQAQRKLKIIEGLLMDLLNNGDKKSDDYIMAVLKDRGPVFDAINRLRAIYPNILHIERPGLGSEITDFNKTSDFRSKEEDVLFASFFEQVTNNKINEDEKKVFNDLVDELKNQEIEV